MRNAGFLGRWGTHACPQCLPSDTVPIRSSTMPCLNGLVNAHYQARPVMTMTSSLMTTRGGRVPSVHGPRYPASAWLIQLRAYAMPSVPVPPIMSLTDMIARCRPLAAHTGARSCPSVRTQPLTATSAPSWTSTMPCHATGAAPWVVAPWEQGPSHLGGEDF